MNTPIAARDQWIGQIAKKTEMSPTEVEGLLKKYGIDPRLTHSVPKRLQILALNFEGTKTGDYETTDIDFSQENLSAGLHAFVSKRNLKGKTSLLKMIRWGLTGMRDLPRDMAGWFRSFTVRFSLDSDVYEVQLSDPENSVGRLVKFARQKEFVVAEFSDQKQFNESMDGFFLHELGLDPLEVIAEQQDGGVEQRHGWNWLFGALWIDPDPKAVFGGGDIQHGKPIRMMQMYLGLPWIATRASLIEARKRLEIDNKQTTKAARQVSNAAAARLAELRKAKDAITSAQKDSTSLAELRMRFSDSLTKFMSSAEKVRRHILLVNEIDADRRGAEEATTAATRELNAFLESQAAGRVFRKLKPVSCPSCEEVYTDAYREEREQHHDCVVCGREDHRVADDVEGVEARLREAVNEATQEGRRLRSRLVDANKRKAEAEADRDRFDEQSKELEKEIETIQSRPDGQMELIKLSAQIEELEKMVSDEPVVEVDDIKLLDVAVNATKDMYDDEQQSVLGKVSDLTAEFARAFGLDDLKSVKLKGNTHMDVHTKGGKKNFGECTAGERMRLKLAATLALIQVAEESGIGRHPGVLLVDSVGSHEVVNENVVAIVTGLAKLQLGVHGLFGRRR
ncbi:hypothetical protein LJR221_002037 [Agrobacterium tumefaciens]